MIHKIYRTILAIAGVGVTFLWAERGNAVVGK